MNIAGGRKYSIFKIACAVVLACMILLVDLWVPLGVAGGVPYVALVLLGWWFQPIVGIFVLAAIATVLTGIGFAFSPEGGILWIVVSNRLLALFAIWTTALLTFLAKRTNRVLENRITERTQQLQKNQALIQGIFDALPIWIYMKNRDGDMLLANKKMADDVGVPVEELRGFPMSKAHWLEENEKQIVLDMDQRVFKYGRREEILEHRNTDANGNVVINHVIKVPLFDGEENVTGLVGVAVDVTERKILEEQLRQSQKMEALGTLAGGIAHDFNNILMPILGYSQLLMGNHHKSSEDYKFANSIFQSGKRAKDLVAQILFFGRRSQTEKKVVDLRHLVQEVASFAHSTLPKSIAIHENFSAASVSVLCESSQIYQVLVNLCVNAGQAISGAGEIELALETVELDAFECFAGDFLSGAHVRIAVTDNGVGMDADTLTHIFEPFFTTKGVGEGTGLGLSTVFGIVQEHGGGIAVSTEPGKGTSFEVFLPLGDSITEQPSVNPDLVQETVAGNFHYGDDEDAVS